MSYKTYTTEAIVCGSTAHNTSDKRYLLFSEEAGMVFASAQSVREERSKQRYALQDFSCIRVSLVKGKSGWRIGSVEALGNPFLRAETRKERGSITYIIAQLRRYVHGEIALPRAYADVCDLLHTNALRTDENSILQELFLVRLLAELGYIAPDASWKKLVDADTLFRARENYDQTMNATITQAIKEGAQASHL